MTSCVAARPAGVFMASGFANETPPTGRSHQRSRPVPRSIDLADEVVLGECAQVVAGRAGRLPEPLGERTRRLRPVLAEDVVDPHAQRVCERPERAGVEHAVLGSGAPRRERSIVSGCCGRFSSMASTLRLQRILCKDFFATVIFAKKSAARWRARTRLAVMANENPLLSPSTLPFGLPDYSAIRPRALSARFRARVRRRRSARSAPSPMVRSMPTFENTMVALETSGKLLGDVSRTFYTVSSADATPEIQEIEETLAPLMSAHHDSIELDSALYWRIKTIHEQLDDLELSPEQRYLVERRFREMSHAGAGLDDAAKERLTALNQRLSTLTTTFEKNLLRDTNDLAVVFDAAADLDGLAEGELSAAAQAAADRGLEGKWVVTLTLFTGHPYLSSLTNRASRKRILDASRARGSRGGENDNRAVLREIVRLRAERAALLGYDSHAAYVTVGRDRRLPRRGARSAAAAGRARRAQRAAGSRRRCRRSSTPSPSRSRSRRTTGRSTPRRCGPPSTTSTAARCGPGSRPSA